MHPKHSSSIPTGPMRKGYSIMALKTRLHLHPCTLLGAVNAWVDLSDRKNPSLSPSCGWMPLLNVQGRVWRPTTTFSPPSAPLGSLHYSKKTFTEPCTSLYIFGTKLDLPTSQTQKKGRRRRRERGVKKKWRQPLKNSFWALYCSSLTVLFQLTGLGYFENFLSIIAGIFMCQLFHRKKYASSLTCCLKPPMFNTSIENSMLDFFFSTCCASITVFLPGNATHTKGNQAEDSINV